MFKTTVKSLTQFVRHLGSRPQSCAPTCPIRDPLLLKETSRGSPWLSYRPSKFMTISSSDGSDIIGRIFGRIEANSSWVASGHFPDSAEATSEAVHPARPMEAGAGCRGKKNHQFSQECPWLYAQPLHHCFHLPQTSCKDWA